MDPQHDCSGKWSGEGGHLRRLPPLDVGMGSSRLPNQHSRGHTHSAALRCSPLQSAALRRTPPHSAAVCRTRGAGVHREVDKKQECHIADSEGVRGGKGGASQRVFTLGYSEDTTR